MGVPRHGVGGLIYVGGSEITGANAWSLNLPKDSIETPEFGDTNKKRVIGLTDWNGTISAWDHTDSKVLTTAALYRGNYALLIYPDRTEATEYYSGNAIFGMRSGGGASAAIARDGDFVGNGTLTVAGWT